MEQTLARYDTIADFYEDFASDPPTSAVDLALLDLVGDVSGLRLLDLACGHGRFARELARRGAEVVGLDISAALLAKARAAENVAPLGVTYVHADAAAPHALAGGMFDGVVCGFGLSDIDNLDGALATVARVLHSGGSFTFSILHPCFPGWGANRNSSWPPGGYYQEGWWRLEGAPPHFLRGKVGANHRMLSTYLNALVRHSLGVEEVVEPPPPLEWTTEAPEAPPCRCSSWHGPESHRFISTGA
jgi:SAM-dependent methyltransferase